MCYSAMVKQDADKLGLQFHARVQYEIYREVFEQRLAGEKITMNKAMEYQFTKNPKTPAQKKIAGLITEWHENEVTRLEAEIFKQKKRLGDAERSLKTKETKKALEDARISTNKIVKAKSDLKKKHGSIELKTDSDSRIYPYHYFSMVYLDEKAKPSVRPFRYHMRPHGEPASFDREYGGCYNARFNNLKRVAFWKDSVAKRRGIMVIEKFYENVTAKDYARKNKLPKDAPENLVLCFEPQPKQQMIIPTIWDVNKQRGCPDLFSAALITDDPLPEIAEAGHDRTPIFMSEDAVSQWLNAKSIDEALEALSERVRPKYGHKLLTSSSAA